MTQVATHPLVLGTMGLGSYLQEIAKIPMLTLEEEQSLAKRYRENEDLESARQLVVSHLRFVVKVAKGYRGYGLPEADLIQEGSIGLMKAVKRFDPTIGVRLVSFAVHWIRAEIHEYILRNWKIVKVATTKAQRKLFFNLRSSKKKLAWLNKAEVDSVAKDLGVKPQDVIEMESRLNQHDVSFDAPVGETDNFNSMSPVAYIKDNRPTPETMLESAQLSTMRGEALQQALDTLDARSRAIIQQRWLSDDKQTLHKLADNYGVSAERIRQLEQAAFTKMSTAIGRRS